MSLEECATQLHLDLFYQGTDLLLTGYSLLQLSMDMTLKLLRCSAAATPSAFLHPPTRRCDIASCSPLLIHNRAACALVLIKHNFVG